MFYCEPCRLLNKWPEGFGMSHGRCEICEKADRCHDVPSGALPKVIIYYPPDTPAPKTPWETLIEKCADGRDVCNCKAAYTTMGTDGRMFCKAGCSANQINAKEIVAAFILKG